MSEKEVDPKPPKEEKVEEGEPGTGSGPSPVRSPPETLSIVTSSSSPSFSQLLAGAMSPAAGPPPILALPVDGGTVPVVALPCFLTPASILDSSGFMGQFTMTHQAVLATVTAQAQMQLQAAYPSTPEVLANSFSRPMLSSISPVPLQSKPPPEPERNVSTPVAEQPPPSDQKSPSTPVVTKSSSTDGYNWRKYGQKQVKSGDRSRSYYKCTNSSCPAKKKVERCPDGRETEIIYMGNHTHEPHHKTPCSKERKRPSVPSTENECLDIVMAEVNESDPSTSKADQNSGNETPDQRLYCSSDCEGDTAVKAEEEPIDHEPDPKRRLSECLTPLSAPVLKTIREPKIVVQSASEAGRINDGYRWRKYGQKIVKGNPNPRSYYRCTYDGCPVRKHVERACDDAKAIIITYEGKHNHSQPPPRSCTDQPASTALLIAAAVAATGDEPKQASNSPDQNAPTDEKASEVGGEKVLESAQTLLSIGFTSTSGEEVGGTNSNRPLFDAAVPVHNS
nr:WRKY transcription factor 25 [Crocus sativus]